MYMYVYLCSYQSNLAKSVLDTILSIQPKDAGGGGGETRETVVFRIADKMLAKIPEDCLPHEVQSHDTLVSTKEYLPSTYMSM